MNKHVLNACRNLLTELKSNKLKAVLKEAYFVLFIFATVALSITSQE